jgi:hypothetical protein
MTHNHLIEQYNLNRDHLLSLYDNIVSFLNEREVEVSYIDLERIVETDIYKIDRQIDEKDKHHESCIADGSEVFLHYDMEDVGGICGRLYDILHVGCGHLWQWSASEESGLEFYGDKAWKIGSTFYLGRPEEEIQMVYDYEKEAGVIAMANLKLILKQFHYSEVFSENTISLFNDYMNTDLEYITSFYRTYQVKNFFEKWQYKAAALPEISVNFPLKIKRRTNQCIALIGVR